MKTWLVYDMSWGREGARFVQAWTRKGAIRKLRRAVGFLGVMCAEHHS